MSRAQFVEEREDEEYDTLPTDDQVEEQEANPEPEPQPEEEDLPEKYRGKSVKEIVQMHQEAEKLLGKHSSEVGELRGVVDQYIQAQLQSQAPTEQGGNKEEEEVDFFADPEKAVNNSISSHPAIKEAQEYAKQAKQSTALQTLQSKHPDIDKIVADPKFAEWIKGSKVRTQLFVQADQQYDTDAADELFSTWKQLNKNAEEVSQADQQTRKKAVKSASTGANRGSSESRGKKKYRRADIIKLMKDDPQRYQALQPEIMAAYREGRVI